MEALSYEVLLAAPRERVWEMWTSEAGLRSWLCLRAHVEPEIGGAYELFWNSDTARPESDSTLGCVILSLDEPRLLEFTWRGADAVADVMNAPGAPVTQVRVRLFPNPGGTRLEVTHYGWGEGPGWERARAWFDRAWRGALDDLRAQLESPRAS